MARANPFGAAVHHAAAEILLGCVCDRVQQEIQLTPFGADLLERCLELPRYAHVAGQQQLAAERVGDGADVRLRFVVEIGRRESGACGCEGACTAGGDAGLIGNADDQTALAGQAG